MLGPSHLGGIWFRVLNVLQIAHPEKRKRYYLNQIGSGWDLFLSAVRFTKRYWQD